MGEVAGNKAAECFPKILLKMLDTLSEHEVKSWNIYPDRFGIALRIRFEHEERYNVDIVDSASHVDMDGGTTPARQHKHTNTTHLDHYARKSQHTAYTRKTPSESERDAQRKILRAKSQRVDDENTSDKSFETVRDVRTGECMSSNEIDTPTLVCCDRGEDTILLSPLPPIEVDFSLTENICEIETCDGEVYSEEIAKSEEVSSTVDVSLNCPCCDKQMIDHNHICDSSNSDTEEHVPSQVLCEYVPKLPKLKQTSEIICLLSEREADVMHSIKRFRCHSCMVHICIFCKSRMKRQNTASICCENMYLSDIELDPT